jgi:hypothetical protein
MKHDTRLHARLSCSGSGRWLNCPGSAIEEAKYPYTTNPAAQEGTKAHEYAEKLLLHGDITECDDVMLNYITTYTDFVFDLCIQDYKIAIEQRVTLDTVVDGSFGTCDVVGIKQDKLIVVDLKYGLGTVSATYNTQLMLYGIGALMGLGEAEKANITTIELVICQPRIAQQFSRDILSKDELREFALIARTQSRRINQMEKGIIPLEFVKGSHCKWCKHVKCEHHRLNYLRGEMF